MKVLITGGAGQITYSLIPLLLSGQVFGPDNFIDLHLLDIELCKNKLEGIKMEIEDSNFTNLNSILTTTDVKKAFTNIDVAVLLGGFPRKHRMERKDLLTKNFSIFKEHGIALNEYSSKHTKVLVVANPANTNCLIAKHFASNIPYENFTSLSYLDQERLGFLLQSKYSVPKNDIKDLIIWGNHSNTLVPDISLCTISVKLTDNDISYVQERGKEVIMKKESSSAFSAAEAIKKHLSMWYFGSNNKIVSFGIFNKNNSYTFPKNLVISSPVKTSYPFIITPVNDLHITNKVNVLLNVSIKELDDEFQIIKDLLI
jgi:malate dehydrogenase